MMAAPSPSKPAKRPNPKNQETADDYERTLATVGKWRVIRCRQDIQYIIQKRWGRARPWTWVAVAYVHPATALGPVLHRRSLGIPDDERDQIIDALTAQGIVNPIIAEN